MAVGRTEVDTRVLDDIIANIGRNEREGNRIAAARVAGRARINAPVDTGALRNSIQDLPGERNVMYVIVGVEYGADVHFGTTRMPGRPYLAEAITQTVRDLRNIYGDVMTNGN